MVNRFIENQVVKSLKSGIVTGVFGARRTGKTVLMRKIKNVLEAKGKKVLLVQGENLDAAEILSSQKLSKIKKLIAGYDYLFIDEAQEIPNIGKNLKLMVDSLSDLAILVSGSASFDLKNKIGEPLVDRIKYFYLYPLSQIEFSAQDDFLSTKEKLEDRLIFGSYPKVALTEGGRSKIEALESIKNGYLLKDILELDNIKDSLFVFNLLRLIAFQIGNDISYAELAGNLNANSKTVMRYLELLEKTFVIFSLPGFSRNLRKEYTKTPRYYFWDNGVRNAIVSNYNILDSRDDVGKLWENYCISERLKMSAYRDIFANRYFWRTYDQKEIDYVEEREGNLFGYEFKWKENKVKTPKEFLETYKNSKFTVINQEKYLDFITKK
jgi:predicted AAA+ superfamily ATPase